MLCPAGFVVPAAAALLTTASPGFLLEKNDLICILFLVFEMNEFRLTDYFRFQKQRADKHMLADVPSNQSLTEA